MLKMNFLGAFGGPGTKMLQTLSLLGTCVLSCGYIQTRNVHRDRERERERESSRERQREREQERKRERERESVTVHVGYPSPSAHQQDICLWLFICMVMFSLPGTSLVAGTGAWQVPKYQVPGSLCPVPCLHGKGGQFGKWYQVLCTKYLWYRGVGFTRVGINLHARRTSTYPSETLQYESHDVMHVLVLVARRLIRVWRWRCHSY